MAYKKKTYKKNVTKVPKSIKKYVNKKLDIAIEDKVRTQNLYSVLGSVDTNWGHVACCNVAQGTDSGQRIGRKIRIKSVTIRGYLAAGDTSNYVRLILSVANTTTPFSSVTLGQSLIEGTGMNGDVLKVIFDKLLWMRYEPVDGLNDDVVAVPRLVSYRKRFKNPIVVTYADNGTTVFDKMLVLSMLSDSVLPPNAGFVHGHVTCTYEDA